MVVAAFFSFVCFCFHSSCFIWMSWIRCFFSCAECSVATHCVSVCVCLCLTATIKKHRQNTSGLIIIYGRFRYCRCARIPNCNLFILFGKISREQLQKSDSAKVNTHYIHITSSLNIIWFYCFLFFFSFEIKVFFRDLISMLYVLRTVKCFIYNRQSSRQKNSRAISLHDKKKSERINLNTVQ